MFSYPNSPPKVTCPEPVIVTQFKDNFGKLHNTKKEAINRNRYVAVTKLFNDASSFGYGISHNQIADRLADLNRIYNENPDC